MRKYYNNDPKTITAKYESKCAETGKTIKAGDTCIYYPTSKSVYHVESNQAQEYGEYMADLDAGYDY
jgi:hypothetical protein